MRFETRTQEEIVNSTAQSLPLGRLFKAASIDGSNLRKLLFGLALEIARIEEKICRDVYDAYFINEGADGLLEVWEEILGIPGECFTIIGKTIDERINQVLTKIASYGTQTESDFIYIGSLLGYVITITPLSEMLYPPYTPPFYPVGAGTRFCAIIKGDDITGGYPPYTPPFYPVYTFSVLECFFNKLKPANVKFLYINN